VIVLPVWRGDILCAAPAFRPGVQCETVDFPGGRVPGNLSPAEAGLAALERELGVPAGRVLALEPLSHDKWPVNSAFSNQGLWPFQAEVAPDFEVPGEYLGLTATADEAGAQRLLRELDCLQCRAVLLEWLNRDSGPGVIRT
jgi:hypothetical protein